MELTMIDTITMSSNLRNMFKLYDFPDGLENLKHYIEECFDSDLRGSLLGDMAWFEHEGTIDTLPTERPSNVVEERRYRDDTFRALQTYCKAEGLHVNQDYCAKN